MKLTTLHEASLNELNLRSLAIPVAAAALSLGSCAKGAEPTQPPKQEVKEQKALETKDYANFTAQWEGKSAKVYTDTLGNRTIGVGFNLERNDARDKMKKIGADFDKVIVGEEELSDDQINSLLGYDIEAAIGNAKRLVSNFDKIQDNVKLIVVDMVFNLGPSRFGKFKKFIAAINSFDYQTAANELVNSKWYGQTKRRAKSHVETLKSIPGPAKRAERRGDK